MSFHERIDEARGRLTRTDRALLDLILAHPADSPLWRGEEVAGRAGVHPAAATRLAQRPGYQGYPQLHGALRTGGAGSLLITDTLHTLDPSPARILAAPAVGAVRPRLYNYSPALSRLDPSD